MSTSEDNGKDPRDATASQKSSSGPGDSAKKTAKSKGATAAGATAKVTEKVSDKASTTTGKTAGASDSKAKGKGKGLKVDEDESKRKGKGKGTKPTKPPKIEGANPSWWAPVMLGLMVFGLIWIVVFYLTQGEYPVPGISYWNLAIGFGSIMVGFMMTTRWR